MKPTVWVVLAVLAATAALLATRAEPLAPTVELAKPVDVVGRATPLSVVARDRGTGLAHVEIRLVPSDGGAGTVVAAKDFPRTSWLGSGVYEVTLDPTVDAAAAKLAEGPATLQVWATDHSWLAGLHRGPRLERQVMIDLTPPRLEVLTNHHIVRQGGTELVVYRVGEDAVTSGVDVGGRLFPGTPGLFADHGVRAALFAVPNDAPNVTPVVVATDAAGNRAQVNFDVAVRPQHFTEKTLALNDGFLTGKVTALLHAAGFEDKGDLVATYRRVNGDVRRATEAHINDLCGDSATTPLWEGAFLRLPNAAPLAGFADRRTYTYKGEVIDHSTHLGYDLASLKGSPVPAGNSGRVVFAGPLAIYGNAILIDHGLGLFSLYGHLSEVGVTPGATVKRGDVIGKTGDTGLAAGDHLHFSILVHGTYADPVEWWDSHWIHDHVEARLAAFPRADATPAAPAKASPQPAAAQPAPPPEKRS
jgi:murein DD-endopeptidase MepM/ murein hydrolase activator NlpD